MNIIRQSTRQLWLSVAASFFGNLGSSIFAFGLGLMLMARTGSSMSFAFSVIVQPIVSILLAPLAGPIADKFPRKTVIIISQLFTIAALAAYIGYYLAGAPHLILGSVLLIIALRITDQFTSNAQSAAKIELVRSEDLTKLASYAQVVSSLSGIGASLLGAVLFVLIPFAAFIAFEVATEVITLLITLALNFHLIPVAPTDADNADAAATTSTWQLFVEGLQFVARQRYLAVFLIMCAGWNFFGAIMSVGLPMLVLKTLHLGNVQYAAVDTMYTIGFMVGALIIARLPEVKYPINNAWRLTFFMAAFTAAIGVTTLLGHVKIVAFIFLTVVLVGFGMLSTFLNTPVGVWIQRSVPPAMQGRFFNLMVTIATCAMPLGVLMYGWLFDLHIWTPASWDLFLFAASGVAMVVVTVLPVWIMKLDLKQAQVV